MSKRALNDRMIKALRPAKAGQRYDVMDAITPGLGVRVTERGTKTFVLVARYPGRTNPARRALGEYGALSLEKARAKARHWHELIGKGVDPADEEKRQLIAEQRKRANTFAAIAEDFIKDKLPAERKGREVERDIRREFMPAWGARPIADITPLDVRNLVKAVKDRGAPHQARNLLTTARRLFAWAIDQHVYGLEISPCDRLKPKAIIGKKTPRSRTLDDDELRALWRATARLSYPYGPLVRALLLTGQRHREIADAKWAEIAHDLTRWTIPKERFKSDAEHVVPLCQQVRAILAGLPRFDGGNGYLFSTTGGNRPTVISDKVKGKMDARMLRTLKAMARLRGENPSRVELRPWVLHDLRRVLRSHLSALRVPDHIAEMVIGHGRQGLQRTYDQHRYEVEMREALTMWDSRLRSIVEPAPANVVAMRA
jgi:Arm DNA-binding domain/Phage integrase central domain/Phage integrase family